MKHALNATILTTWLLLFIFVDFFVKDVLEFIAGSIFRRSTDPISHGPLLFEFYYYVFNGSSLVSTVTGSSLLVFGHCIVAKNIKNVSAKALVVWLGMTVIFLMYIMPMLLIVSLWLQARKLYAN